jgi:peptidyl-prolyl cis-trans isomerase B (cyclophilin B)
VPTNKQRRESARRHLERQLQRRQEQETAQKRRMLIATIAGSLILVVVVVVVVIAVTNDNGTKPAAAGSSSASASASASSSASAFVSSKTTGPCGYTSADLAQNPNLKNTGFPPDPKPTPTKTIVADFATNRGPIQVTFDGKAAPCNVQSLAYLIGKKFFNNTPCPRAVDQGIYAVQCGDPTGTGSGGPSYTVKDENLTAAKYTAGAVAMANGGPNTNGSQFFFVTKDSSKGLAKSYTVVGHVTKGLDILQKVVAGGNDGSNQAGGGKPKLPLGFSTVKIASVVGGGPTPGTGPTPTVVTPSPIAAPAQPTPTAS